MKMAVTSSQTRQMGLQWVPFSMSKGKFWITFAGRQSIRKYLRRLSILASVGLAASLLFPRGLGAQLPTYSPQDVDARKVQPLDLKPGCWQVSTHISGIAAPIHTPDEILATLTPGQRAALTPEQLAQAIASVQGSERLEAQLAEKGGRTTAVVCTWAPFFEAGIEVYGTELYGIPGESTRCTRTIQVSGEKRNIHVACPTIRGDPTSGRLPTRIADEYERLDSENFRGTQHRVTDLGNGRTQDDTTTLIVGKWTGDAVPHMPHSPASTGINGKKALGPQAVAWLDPFRVVATIGGRQFLAAQTYVLTIFSTARTNKEWGPRLSGIFQQLIMHAGVAYEAVQLHLDIQQPWLNQLHNSGFDARALGPFGSIVAPQGPQNPFDFHAIWAVNEALPHPASWTDAHAEMARFSSLAHQTVVAILWNAYFSQSKTEAEKQVLLHTVQEKYKITVIDPDFFYGETSP
jgi:hypothetical protein